MVFIYALQLQEGKYYIGKTNKPQIRLESHFNSHGSEWTKIYKPLKVIELIPNCNDYDEDKYTRIYMDKYGIHNVRGGSFVSVKLEKSTIDILHLLTFQTPILSAYKIIKKCKINRRAYSYEVLS